MGDHDYQTGAVTFLDVLGWKGIWQRMDEPIKILQRIISTCDKVAKRESRGDAMRMPDYSMETIIRSISDTIVLFSAVPEDRAHIALDLHGAICANAVRSSIMECLPIRGATSFGEYSLDKNHCCPVKEC